MEKVNTTIINRMQSDVAMIPQLAGHLIASGGKRVRPLLVLATTALFDTKADRQHKLAACVEFIHTATLLHDDVVDASLQRRGQDSANAVFGNEATVLVGDFLFSRSFQLMTEDGDLEVLRVLSSASAIIAEGEVMQLTTAGNLKTTQDEYLDVIKGKTSALFSAACEVGGIVGQATEEQIEALKLYGTCLGIAFQIADDILDYTANQETLGKTIGDDFREGKMTLPIILALGDATTDEKAFWQRTIKDKNQEEGDLKTALDILSKHNTLVRGLDVARIFGTEAKQALNVLPDTEIRTLLAQLIDFVIDREY